MPPKLLSSLLVASLALLLARPAAAADVTLRFSSVNQASTRVFKEQFAPLKEAIERDSGGRIAIDLRWAGTFGRPAEIFAKVESGEIDIAATLQGYAPGRFPRSAVMELPLLFETGESGTYAFWKLFEEGLLAEEYASVKVLSLYVLPPYGIFTSGIDVTSLRDFRGLRIRSPGLIVSFALARLGAIPLGLPVDYVGQALSGSLIDAITFSWENAMTTQGDGKLVVEQVPVMVDARIASPAFMVVMNKGVYEGLPEDLRAVIDRHTGLDLSLSLASGRDRWEEETRQRIAADGNHTIRKFTVEQRREMAARVAPVVEEWAADMARQGLDGAKLLERARQLIRERSPSAS